MKDEDRSKACEFLQEIETDLTYSLIETYKAGKMNDFANILRLLRPLVAINKEICSS